MLALAKIWTITHRAPLWLWLVLALGIALGVGAWRIDAAAYARGAAAVEARFAEEVRALELRISAASDRASAAEEARLAAERVLDELRADLDEQSRADPDAGRRALGAGSVLRIDRIRRED